MITSANKLDFTLWDFFFVNLDSALCPPSSCDWYWSVFCRMTWLLEMCGLKPSLLSNRRYHVYNFNYEYLSFINGTKNFQSSIHPYCSRYQRNEFKFKWRRAYIDFSGTVSWYLIFKFFYSVCYFLYRL